MNEQPRVELLAELGELAGRFPRCAWAVDRQLGRGRPRHGCGGGMGDGGRGIPGGDPLAIARGPRTPGRGRAAQ